MHSQARAMFLFGSLVAGLHKAARDQDTPVLVAGFHIPSRSGAAELAETDRVRAILQLARRP